MDERACETCKFSEEHPGASDKGKRYDWPDGSCSWRVGKKRAGRLLDGREWNEAPNA